MKHLTEMTYTEEGWTERKFIHPESNSISADAPIYPDDDRENCVLVTRDRFGQFHIWGGENWHYPIPSSTGLVATMHLTRAVNIDDTLEWAWES